MEQDWVSMATDIVQIFNLCGFEKMTVLADLKFHTLLQPLFHVSADVLLSDHENSTWVRTKGKNGMHATEESFYC